MRLVSWSEDVAAYHPWRFIAICASIAAVGVYLTALTAVWDDAWTRDRLVWRCETTRSAPYCATLSRDTEASRLDRTLATLEARREKMAATPSGPAESLVQISDAIDHVRAQRAALPGRVLVVGFRDMFVWLTWIAGAAFLGALIGRWSGRVSAARRRTMMAIRRLPAFAWIYLPTLASMLLSNLLWASQRRLISFVQMDVSPLSFWAQQLLVGWRSLLLASALVAAQRLSWRGPRAGAVQDTPALARSIRALTMDWALDGLLLLLAIGPEMVEQWHALIALGDRRYLPSALVFQASWAIVWFYSSRPLWEAVQEWNRHRYELLAVAQGKEAQESAELLLHEADPLSLPVRLAVSFAGVSTFVGPILASLLARR